MDGASGYASWLVWAVLIVGTVAFWAVIFLAVRALFVGRDTSDPLDPDDSRNPDPLQERLDRGEITTEEYAHLRAEVHTVSGQPRS